MKVTKTNVIFGITRNISFRFVEVSDAELILDLRLDPSRNCYLSPIANDVASQRKWIEAYKTREAAKREFYYVILDKQQCELGLVRLYDFIDDSFNWGSWVLRPNAPISAAIESALMVYEIAFYSLQFTNARFEVKRENEPVIRFHKRSGAVCVNEDAVNCYFRMDKTTYEKMRRKYARYLLLT
jgi:RimJ/RimL family protein N-acetyltransferase